MMVKIYCFTNLDIKEEWPIELPELPREGDEIESMTKHGDFRLALRVCKVRWSYSHTGYFPVIELHDTHSRSVRSFYEWYAPLVGRSVGVIFYMKWWLLAALIVFPGPLHYDLTALENLKIISAASRYQIYEPLVNHKTRRPKHEKISTLQIELSAEMARQAGWADRAVSRRHSEHD